MSRVESRNSSGKRASPTLVVAAVIAAAICASPCSVGAQALERLTFRGENGVGAMLSTYQSQTLDYSLVVQGSARVSVNIVDILAAQASFSSWYFPSASGDGQQFSILGGLRFQPRVASIGRFQLDANVGLGISGGQYRAAFDAGIGFEFALGSYVSIGPVIRYGQLFTSGEDYRSDAQYCSAGLSVALRFPDASRQRALPPNDTDHDGVLDHDDLCIHEPAGSLPDPDRRGCPLRDSDGDGITDARDLCPFEPPGELADTNRIGCPSRDTDQDGVRDPRDLCPTTPQGSHPDPDLLGCPDGDDDGDGVPNHRDLCPHESQGAQPDPGFLGCPLGDTSNGTRSSSATISSSAPSAVIAPEANPSQAQRVNAPAPHHHHHHHHHGG